jgi:hypothetical protein
MPTALPPPSPNDGDPSRSQRTRERSRKGSAIPSAEEILAMLVRLNGLVALKLISSAQATVMQRNLRTILDYHVRQVQGGQPGLPQAALAELCRKDPRILNLLEPLLTDAQVDWLMGDGRKDSDDEG